MQLNVEARTIIAQNSLPATTNLRHELVAIDAAAAFMLRNMKGEKTREELDAA